MVSNLFSIFDPQGLMISGWVLSGVMILFSFLTPLYTASSTMVKLKNWLNGVLKSEFDAPMVSGVSSHLVTFGVSAFFFVMFMNIIGLAPYVFTSTSHLFVTLGMAIPFWFSGYLFGWLLHINTTLSHLVPTGTPYILMPVMVLIETVSALIRPITLSVRLMANMVAGHLLLTLVGGAVSGWISMMPVLLSQTILMGLELAVALIQAYVFSVLVLLYAKEVPP